MVGLSPKVGHLQNQTCTAILAAPEREVVEQQTAIVCFLLPNRPQHMHSKKSERPAGGCHLASGVSQIDNKNNYLSPTAQ
jgi:hypothetical protein